MNTFKVKPKSWHYHVVSSYARVSQWELESGKYDFCKYLRKVVSGLFLALLFGLLITVLLAPLTITFSWVAASLVTFTWVKPDINDMGFWFGVTEIVIICLIGLLALGFFTNEYLKEKDITLFRKVSPPGFISQAYDSFKNKYCLKVEYVSEDKAQAGVAPETPWPRQ